MNGFIYRYRTDDSCYDVPWIHCPNRGYKRTETQFLCLRYESIRRKDEKKPASELATIDAKTKARTEIEVATESSITDVNVGNAAT